MSALTLDALNHIMPRAGARADDWQPALDRAAGAWRIDTPPRIAMWLANLAYECAELTELEESLNYKSPQRLRAVYPRFFVDDATAFRYVTLGAEAIASRVYSERLGNGDEASGDGWRYRGRGPVMLTFRANYGAASAAILDDAEMLINEPELLIVPNIGAASAAWFWNNHRCSEYADAGDFDGVCDVINHGRKTIALGDSNGFDKREKYFNRAREALYT